MPHFCDTKTFSGLILSRRPPRALKDFYLIFFNFWSGLGNQTERKIGSKKPLMSQLKD